MLLAACAFMVACGGNSNNKGNEASGQQSEETVQLRDINSMDVEEVVNTYLPAMADAASANDIVRFTELNNEYMAWEDKIVRGVYYRDYCEALDAWRNNNSKQNKLIDEFRIAVKMHQQK